MLLVSHHPTTAVNGGRAGVETSVHIGHGGTANRWFSLLLECFAAYFCAKKGFSFLRLELMLLAAREEPACACVRGTRQSVWEVSLFYQRSRACLNPRAHHLFLPARIPHHHTALIPSPMDSSVQVGPDEWRVSWEQFAPSRRKHFPELESVAEK